MRNYLLYSSSAHAALLLGVLFFMARNPLQMKKTEAYFVDFVGPSTVVTMRPETKAAAPEAAPEAARAPAAARPQKPEYREEEDFAGGLPKPSVLSGAATLFEPKAGKAAEAADEGNTTSLFTDSQNFPYPWYIAQVREALWNAWSGKMPAGGGLRCTMRFAIKRDGSVRGVSVEKTSGNRLFDNAAENSVRSAAPFAALPDDFFEDTLTVHVEFKAGD